MVSRLNFKFRPCPCPQNIIRSYHCLLNLLITLSKSLVTKPQNVTLNCNSMCKRRQLQSFDIISWNFAQFQYTLHLPEVKRNFNIQYKKTYIRVQDLGSQEIRKWQQNLKTAQGLSLVSSLSCRNKFLALGLKKYVKTYFFGIAQPYLIS